MLTDAVTMPGAASAAAGVSSIAATKTPVSFMANLLSLVETRERNERSQRDCRISQKVNLRWRAIRGLKHRSEQA
jgi:hypothetical protein